MFSKKEKKRLLEKNVTPQYCFHTSELSSLASVRKISSLKLQQTQEQAEQEWDLRDNINYSHSCSEIT